MFLITGATMKNLSTDIKEIDAAKNIVNRIQNQVDNETKDLIDSLTVLENTNKASKKMEGMKKNV